MSNTSNNQEKSSSRRRFVETMGKVAVGLGVFLAGGTLNGQQVQARSNKASSIPIACCGGSACPTYQCPQGTTYAGYCWSCSTTSGTYSCQDCLKNNRYYCTYPQYQEPCC